MTLKEVKNSIFILANVVVDPQSVLGALDGMAVCVGHRAHTSTPMYLLVCFLEVEEIREPGGHLLRQRKIISSQ